MRGMIGLVLVLAVGCDDSAETKALKAEVKELRAAVTALQAQLNANDSGLVARMAAVEEKTAPISREVIEDYDSLVFSGVNVYVQDGSGDTDGDVNGLGNLIVGYNEQGVSHRARSGSHNLIVGPEHLYESFGGVAFGYGSALEGPMASVLGGEGNHASGLTSAVLGGRDNHATGYGAAISGGSNNTSSGTQSSVGGGAELTASGPDSWVAP